MALRKIFWFASFSLFLLGSAGCYRHQPCDEPEQCNYLDDNCNGLLDEGFVDERGRYNQPDHCGACSVACDALHPHALETSCEPLGESYGCVARACQPGYRLHDRGCLPEVEVSCLACGNDADCTVFGGSARCVDLSGGRCVRACGGGCPQGFACREEECWPETDLCACTPALEAVEFPCRLEAGGAVCGGSQLCERGVLGPCEPLFGEECNGQDDNCDGLVDEDFTDDQGRYVHVEHCGACNQPCVVPGPNMEALCLTDGEPRCVVECQEEFVDLDGLEANGCECERIVGSWPPSRLGVDADCDGDLDDSQEFIFVTAAGSDSNEGTRLFPVRTFREAMTRAVEQNKTVLVSGGLYHERLQLVAGVEVYGGYSPDFAERDLSRFVTALQPHDGRHGEPVVTCRNITVATVWAGVTLHGSDAVEPGAGSTTVYADGCGSAVRFEGVTVIAGRGAPGRGGADSSDALADWGLSSLLELAGQDGGAGRRGRPTDSSRCVDDRLPGGAGGRRSCPDSVVHGGAGAEAACVDGGCWVDQPCGNGGCSDFMVDGECDIEAVWAAAVPNPPGSDGQGPNPGLGGEATFNAPTNRGTCHFCDDNPTLPRDGLPGQAGGQGGDGRAGEGCADGAGLFDVDLGLWSAGRGSDGLAGTNGSGGGGGSSGAGFDVIGGIVEDCSDALGGSGGGGGSGGCGAPGATGGRGGGGSIGVALRLRPRAAEGPTFVDVTLVAAPGGAGGGGGIGAAGGPGGAGGRGGGTDFWCSRRGGRGGDGGSGGAGGGGGGGCGGGTIGFYVVPRQGNAAGYVEELMVRNGVESLPPGGRGGAGGFSPGSSGTDGQDGLSEAYHLAQ